MPLDGSICIPRWVLPSFQRAVDDRIWYIYRGRAPADSRVSSPAQRRLAGMRRPSQTYGARVAHGSILEPLPKRLLARACSRGVLADTTHHDHLGGHPLGRRTAKAARRRAEVQAVPSFTRTASPFRAIGTR
jgi:hypothetical protein